MFICESIHSPERIILSDFVVKRFRKYQQNLPHLKEAGGQLFAKFSYPDIYLNEATGPRWCDKRTRNSFVPNRLAEKIEIKRKFRKGLHYIGDWHTHPETVPVPSTLDKTSIVQQYRYSTHKLGAFVLIVVGTGVFPDSLSVKLFNDTEIKGITLNVNQSAT